MTDFDYGAFRAELDAILAAPICDVPATSHTLLGDLNAVGCSARGGDVRPDIVAEASAHNAEINQENKASDTIPAVAGQYAETTPSHAPASQLIIRHPSAHQLRDASVTVISIPSPYQQGKRDGPAWRTGASSYRASASSLHQAGRKPRRAVAQIDKVALHKTWDGTKRKQRCDKLSEAEKFSAAVWAAAAASGLAVSLNLGISREATLAEHADPKRRMTQNLSRHLSEAGLGDLPYAFVFEMTPKREGGRLHLHGVIDISGLTEADVERLNVALVRAASVATGATGGQRQLDMAPIHDPVGWADYLLKDATRTAGELDINHPFMISKPMRRMAKAHFELLRAEVRDRAKAALQPRSSVSEIRSTGTKSDGQGFTLRSGCDTRRLSGERDKTSAGDLRKQARHQPHSPRPTVARSQTVSARPDATVSMCRRSVAVAALR